MQDCAHRLVVIYDRWSHDHWEDMLEPAPVFHPGTCGPDLADLRLSRTFSGHPSKADVQAALADTDALLSRTDGCHQRRAFAVLDQDGWVELVGPHGERFLELCFHENESPSPIVEQCYDGSIGMMHTLSLVPSPGKPTATRDATNGAAVQNADGPRWITS